MIYRLIVFVFLLTFFLSCSHQKSSTAKEKGDTITLKYAENLTMVRFSNYTLVDLKNPWKQGKSLHRYIVLHNRHTVPSASLPQGTIIKQPISRSVVFGTAHASLLLMLKAHAQIAGVCDLKYMLLPNIHNQVKVGKIIDCGDGMMPNVEKIVEMGADALLVSPFENSGGYGALEKLGIPLIECADYMETSPLGRAEWMKFYGLLFGREKEADSLFQEVETAYLKSKKEVNQIAYCPSVLTERRTGTTWYVPGGRSTIAIMLKDAGAKYPFSDTSASGSIPMPFENVLEKAGESDVWIFKYNDKNNITRNELLAEYGGYRTLKAFKTQNIWACNASYKPYFEETPFRPDYLLKDFIILFHPSKNKQQLRYFKQVK